MKSHDGGGERYMSHASEGFVSRNSRKSRHCRGLLTVSAIDGQVVTWTSHNSSLRGESERERNPKGIGKVGDEREGRNSGTRGNGPDTC